MLIAPGRDPKKAKWPFKTHDRTDDIQQSRTNSCDTAVDIN